MQNVDKKIAALLKERKVKGLELLFEEYYRPLVIWADTFLNDVTSAEDLVQEFFVKIWERELGEKFLPETLRGYLFTSVKNLSLNWLEKLDPLKQAYDVTRVAECPTEEYNELNEQMLASIEAEIEKLSPQSRKVMKCVYLKGMRYKETANELNISVATVKTLLVHALKKLRESLDGENYRILFFFIKKSASPFNRFLDSPVL